MEILDPSGQTPDSFDPQSTIHVRTHFRVYENINDPVFNIKKGQIKQCLILNDIY